ncbi:hypothetical protein [Nocardioides convexus]|uniref:hypothetical protein n=1 Tax=Nocardioides convexus TaxID=2712224 RepID=UPI0024183B32|nr:hypothetical protein [Nocardioides convexus]
MTWPPSSPPSTRTWCSPPTAGAWSGSARRPVLGADRSARFLVGLVTKYVAAQAEVDLVLANGLPAVAVRQEGVLTSLVLLTVAEDRVRRIDIVRAPAKAGGGRPSAGTTSMRAAERAAGRRTGIRRRGPRRAG